MNTVKVDGAILFVSDKMVELYGDKATLVTDPTYLMPDGNLVDSDTPLDKGQLVTYKTVSDYVANGTNVVAVADIPEGKMIDGKGGLMAVADKSANEIKWQQPSTKKMFTIPLTGDDIIGASTRMTATFTVDCNLVQPYTFSNGERVVFTCKDWNDLFKKAHELLNKKG